MKKLVKGRESEWQLAIGSQWLEEWQSVVSKRGTNWKVCATKEQAACDQAVAPTEEWQLSVVAGKGIAPGPVEGCEGYISNKRWFGEVASLSNRGTA